MTKRDDGRKGGHSRTATWVATSGAYTRCYLTSWHALEDLTPDKDDLIQQIQFDFGVLPEAAELTAEEAAALDFLQKKGANAEQTKRYLRLISRIKLHRTSETDASMRIARPPGSLLATISEFVFSKKTLERVVRPIIADMQAEYCEALAAKRPYKAAWVRVRGGWSFFKALGMYSILRTFVEIWGKVRSV